MSFFLFYSCCISITFVLDQTTLHLVFPLPIARGLGSRSMLHSIFLRNLWKYTSTLLLPQSWHLRAISASVAPHPRPLTIQIKMHTVRVTATTTTNTFRSSRPTPGNAAVLPSPSGTTCPHPHTPTTIAVL